MVRLSRIQATTAAEIIRLGRMLGQSGEHIHIALVVATLESSLGANTGHNPASSALGLYQYLEGSWPEGAGDRRDHAAAIRMFFKDLDRWQARYDAHRQAMAADPAGYARRPENRRIPVDLSFVEYAYVKHHDGANACGAAFTAAGKDGGLAYYLARRGHAESLCALALAAPATVLTA